MPTSAKVAGLLFTLTVTTVCLCACSSTPKKSAQPRPPSPTSNACTLFKKNPNWYWEALNTYHRWGVPISVQMAIMQRESDFQSGAKPPPKTALLGLFSWGNITSAYGYAQALNGTWDQYQRETGRYHTKRDHFGDSSDFIGWYCNKANQNLGIPLNNAYALYLAYHEGLKGYQKRTYLNKPDLLQIAQTVQQRANAYRAQISKCKYDIKQP